MQSGATINIIGGCSLAGLVLLAALALGSTSWESPANLDTGAVSNAVTVPCTGPGNTNCCSSNAICFYMKPDGNDYNHGTSEADAVKTLSKVQQLTQDYARKYGPIKTHIEVRIKKGIYQQPRAVQWTYYTPGYSISFMPSDYKWGTWGSFEARPVFSGVGSDGSNWFEFLAGPGEWTRLAFYYLEVRRYARGGIVLSGGSNTPGHWNGYNTVYGMYFSRLGTYWAHGSTGYAGVFLVNSRNNFIENNHFIHLENEVGVNRAAIHAVYLKNWSSNNLIRGNRMSYISGDAVRVRNESNDNDIRANALYRTGEAGQYSDFYQDVSRECYSSRESTNQECPSWRNWFRYNTVACGYNGTPVKHFYFFGKGTQPENRDCVPSACIDYGDDRVETASNKENCP